MMNDDSAHQGGNPSGSERRFEKTEAEQILRRAADEQARLDLEKDHSFSLEQLQEIAAEAGISAEAVHAAARAHEHPAQPAAGQLPTEDAAGAGWLPASWSPAARRIAVLAVGIAVVGGLVAVGGFWPVVITVMVIVLVLAVLGLGPG